MDKREILIDKLASIEHERWSDWQKHLHSCGKRGWNDDLILPARLVKHWECQFNRKYKDLSEEDKQKDRREVMRYFELIENYLKIR